MSVLHRHAAGDSGSGEYTPADVGGPIDARDANRLLTRALAESYRNPPGGAGPGVDPAPPGSAREWLVVALACGAVTLAFAVAVVALGWMAGPGPN